MIWKQPPNAVAVLTLTFYLFICLCVWFFLSFCSPLQKINDSVPIEAPRTFIITSSVSHTPRRKINCTASTPTESSSAKPIVISTLCLYFSDKTKGRLSPKGMNRQTFISMARYISICFRALTKEINGVRLICVALLLPRFKIVRNRTAASDNAAAQTATLRRAFPFSTIISAVQRRNMQTISQTTISRF